MRPGLALLLVTSAACGGAGPRAPASIPQPDLPDTARIAGGWRWTHVSEADGVRRVEIEDWALRPAGRRGGVIALVGAYRREVFLLSLDGTPFRCNQDLTIALRSGYELRGELDGDGGWLEETAAAAEPSPCAGPRRATTRYQIAARPGRLDLTWPGGRQVLRRPPAGAIAARPVTRASPALSGTWRWTNRHVSPRGEVRVERETWRLEEQPGGEVRGSYRREVTRFAEDGPLAGCGGAAVATRTDEYELRGWRRGDEVLLSETAAAPGPAVCGAEPGRHLDHAGGTVYPGALELTWRGRNRQVLRRLRGPAAPLDDDAAAPVPRD